MFSCYTKCVWLISPVEWNKPTCCACHIDRYEKALASTASLNENKAGWICELSSCGVWIIHISLMYRRRANFSSEPVGIKSFFSLISTVCSDHRTDNEEKQHHFLILRYLFLFILISLSFSYSPSRLLPVHLFESHSFTLPLLLPLPQFFLLSGS